MAIHEPECVQLKRRGAEYVSKTLEGMSLQEQLAFWKKRTQKLIEKQSKIKNITIASI